MWIARAAAVSSALLMSAIAEEYPLNSIFLQPDRARINSAEFTPGSKLNYIFEFSGLNYA
ncbi:MAG: hypothetical protein ACRD1W_11635 [Vicinamibacterales bacterium]